MTWRRAELGQDGNLNARPLADSDHERYAKAIADRTEAVAGLIKVGAGVLSALVIVHGAVLLVVGPRALWLWLWLW